MKAPRWIRLDDRHLRNTGGGESTVAKRVYGADGALWPRLVISIRKSSYLAGPPPLRERMAISCSTKRGPGSFWEAEDIPVELAVEVLVILAESMPVLLSGEMDQGKRCLR